MNSENATLHGDDAAGTVRERAILTRSGIHSDSAGHSHWGGIVASVVSGLGLTLLLVLIGSAAGLVAGSDETDGDAIKGITAALGAWTFISMVIGALVGCFVGGRLARWLTRGTALWHAVTSWGLAVVLGAFLLAIMSLGLLGTASNVAGGVAGNEQATASADTTATNADGTTATKQDKKDAKKAAKDTANGLGKASWALALSLVATLVASIVGWMLGARRPLMGFERDDTPGAARAS
ncbi:MAG: PhnA-like protein [Thermoleophilia bacterium]|nr:PhnA-like protein [Thermoleophilia bacterium]